MYCISSSGQAKKSGLIFLGLGELPKTPHVNFNMLRYTPEIIKPEQILLIKEFNL
jgi:hypothetical protein